MCVVVLSLRIYWLASFIKKIRLIIECIYKWISVIIGCHFFTLFSLSLSLALPETKMEKLHEMNCISCVLLLIIVPLCGQRTDIHCQSSPFIAENIVANVMVKMTNKKIVATITTTTIEIAINCHRCKAIGYVVMIGSFCLNLLTKSPFASVLVELIASKKEKKIHFCTVLRFH